MTAAPWLVRKLRPNIAYHDHILLSIFLRSLGRALLGWRIEAKPISAHEIGTKVDVVHHRPDYF